MKNLIILFVLIVMPLSLYSEEGFWSALPSTTLKNSENRPVQLDKWYNNGIFIYKDAICAIGEGGSGSFISKKGLILTNYHLIRKYIVEKDSLVQNGFIATSNSKELKLENLYIKILLRSIDVSDIVNQGIDLKQKWSDIETKVGEVFPVISIGNKQEIKREFHGRKHYMHEYKIISDVRLVMCPPIHMAQYGGDLSNWKWPRYSADFAIVRGYENGLPYSPAGYFHIRKNGVSKGEAIAICGYPRGASYDLTSAESMYNFIPNKAIEAELLDLRIKTLTSVLDTLSTNRQPFKNLISSLNNEKVKYVGMIRAFDKFNIPEKLKDKELACANILESSSPDRYLKFNNSCTILDSLCLEYNSVSQVYNQFQGAIKPIILFGLARCAEYKDKMSVERLREVLDKATTAYPIDLDRSMAKVMVLYLLDHQSKLIPPILKNCHINTLDYIDSIYKTSDLFNTGLILSDKFSIQDLHKDMGYILYHQIDSIYSIYHNKYQNLNNKIQDIKHYILTTLYDEGCIDWSGTNGTMRISYGNVQQVDTNQNENVTILNEWINHSVILPSYNYSYNFTTTAHTSSGNSGSPVLNTKGEIVGLNFDRDIDGICSDYYYMPENSRSICVNSRYIWEILSGNHIYSQLLKEIND